MGRALTEMVKAMAQISCKYHTNQEEVGLFVVLQLGCLLITPQGLVESSGNAF